MAHQLHILPFTPGPAASHFGNRPGDAVQQVGRRKAAETGTVAPEERTMAHKKRRGPAPVPPENQPQAGPADMALPTDQATGADHGSPFEEQDPKRRLGR